MSSVGVTPTVVDRDLDTVVDRCLCSLLYTLMVWLDSQRIPCSQNYRNYKNDLPIFILVL